MAKLLKLRRGTDTQHSSFTGAEGEVTVNTTNDSLHVHDGTTAGGRELLRTDLSNLPAGTIDNADINNSAAIANSKLATSGVTSGTYGSSSAIPSITVNDRGIVTSATTNAIDSTSISNGECTFTGDGDLLALDAKINIEENALFRQPDLESQRDGAQEDEKERAAAEHDLNYVSLDGSIACMVNGAGLAMATMDLIKLHGGEPANFLDVGGGATPERVAAAFKLILSNDSVRAILVNIFGGIVRCDLIAEGIIRVVREVNVGVPVIVRLEGTNVERGRKLLAESGLTITAAKDLTDAAKKAIEAAEGDSR